MERRQFVLTCTALAVGLLAGCDNETASKLSGGPKKTNQFADLAEGGDREAVQALHRLADGAKGTAADGDPFAQHHLGYLYYYGKGGLVQDYQRAGFYFERSARQGITLSAYNLGLMSMNREDGRFPKDAVKWFTSSMQGGVPITYAALKLGGIYERDDIVKRDLAAAFLWYEKAALDKDGVINRVGAWKAGYMLWRGEGRDKDVLLAVRYLTQAAKAHVAEAQYMLGYIYSVGENGLPPDPIQAGYWVTLAALNNESLKAQVDPFLAKLPQTKELAKARDKALATFKNKVVLSNRSEANRVTRLAGMIPRWN